MWMVQTNHKHDQGTGIKKHIPQLFSFCLWTFCQVFANTSDTYSLCFDCKLSDNMTFITVTRETPAMKSCLWNLQRTFKMHNVFWCRQCYSHNKTFLTDVRDTEPIVVCAREHTLNFNFLEPRNVFIFGLHTVKTSVVKLIALQEVFVSHNELLHQLWYNVCIVVGLDSGNMSLCWDTDKFRQKKKHLTNLTNFNFDEEKAIAFPWEHSAQQLL